ncbi:MAG: hypothetical protein KGS72_13120 [Cyanobacteria bacterium REEB67]|nr:hypothetical protein [Cyanobacteria bacterium REEB67]
MKVATPPIETILEGTWHNAQNAELRLKLDGAGRITGYFIKDANLGHEGAEWFPLAGLANGDLFAFCVDFSKYGSMMTWTGKISNPPPESFRALWQIVSDFDQSTGAADKIGCSGEETFVAGSCPLENSKRG